VPPTRLLVATALLAAALLPAGPATAGAPAAAPAAPRAPDAGRDPVAERLSAALSDLERDRRNPRALVDLARLAELEDEAPDLSRLARAYSQVAADQGAASEARALARLQLAGIERTRGNLNRAQAELKRIALLRDWQVVGPFDDDGKRGHDAVYPPEQEVDLAARYPGKVREVGWRALPPEASAWGLVDVGASLRPAREVTAYALTAVESPRDQRVQLWAGASGAVKVWVNGALVLSDAAYHLPRLDQLGAWVTLRRGPNRILLKLSHQQGRMGFYLRLADATGAPLALPAAAPGAPAPRAAEARAERVDGALKALERRAKAARGAEEARARLDLALALWVERAGDAREQRAAAEARRAAALRPGWAEAQLAAAALEEDDPNRRRAALEAVLSADPSEPRALLALARHELQRGRSQEAVRLAERAAAAAPRLGQARVALAQAMELSGLGSRAAVEIARAAREVPWSPAVAEEAARSAQRLDRMEEATLQYRKVLGLRYDRDSARASLTQLLLDRGDLEGALGLLSVSLRLEPADLYLLLRRADLLAWNGRADEAEAAFAAALRLCPEEPEIWERRGRARLRAGRQKEGLQDLHQALELKPQNSQLKELTRLLEPERERFERPYAQDARELARAAPAPRPDEDAVVLAEVKVTRVFPNGLSATWVQQVVKVYTPRGADAFRSHAIGYAPDRQEIRVDRARVLKPDGTAVETWQESERSQSEPWYRLYYDTRVRALSFPALSAGDVLELAYRTDDVASDNLLSDYFGDLTFLADRTRTLRIDYLLLVPEGRAIHSNQPALPGLEHGRRALPGGVVEHRWTARDVPRVEPEPGMPGWSEVTPFLHVSTYASWDEVAAFYWRLVRDQLRPTPEVRQTAERIAAEAGVAPGRNGARTPEAELRLIRAVYDFVVTSTRYVGLEFGIHGYKPYRVDQVLSRRFGDCKDKASLMHALLESLGVDSRLVLLRMRRLGRVPERPASLAVFNHAILYLPSQKLWLDGTATWHGSRELPGDDRGATVLVVNPGAPPWFGATLEAAPGDNLTQTSLEVSLGADGRATVRGTSRVAGERAAAYRGAYQAEEARRATFEQAWNRTFPGLEVERVSLSDLTRLEDDVSMTFELQVARYANPDRGGLRFTPFGQSATYAETWAPLSSRRWPLFLGQPWENRFAYRHELPPGWTAVEVPAPASFAAPFGSFEVRYLAEGGTLLAEGRVAFRQSLVPVADYPAFRDFLSRIDRAMARTVRVAPAAGPAASASGAGPPGGAP
jgi:tetratricopeptide (TPR) repeat protein/transglutaminase-like putative cysteine protease